MRKADIIQLARWSKDHLAFVRFINATKLCHSYKRTSRVRGKLTATPQGAQITVTYGPMRTTEKVAWSQMTSFNVDHLDATVRGAFTTMMRIWP